MKHNWAQRLQGLAAGILQLAIFLVAVGALTKGDWLVAFTGAVVFVLTFAPAIIERRFGIYVPVELTLALCFFLYASFGLGEVGDFYIRFPWWDLMLHSFSAMVIGLIGFLAVYVFYMTHRVVIKPIYVALASFCVAVTTGTIWEAFEFSMDRAFGMNMQKSGLVDTMTDLLINFLGAAVAALIGYLYVKNGDTLLADRLIKRFVEKNPNLFPDQGGYPE